MINKSWQYINKINIVHLVEFIKHILCIMLLVNSLSEYLTKYHGDEILNSRQRYYRIWSIGYFIFFNLRSNAIFISLYKFIIFNKHIRVVYNNRIRCSLGCVIMRLYVTIILINQRLVINYIWIVSDAIYLSYKLIKPNTIRAISRLWKHKHHIIRFSRG